MFRVCLLGSRLRVLELHFEVLGAVLTIMGLGLGGLFLVLEEYKIYSLPRTLTLCLDSLTP